MDQLEIHRLIFDLHMKGYRVWLYTGYELSEIPGYILRHCHTIKTGRYRQELATPGARLASSNQKFWRWVMVGVESKLEEIAL
jgi:hypothetical protein